MPKYRTGGPAAAAAAAAATPPPAKAAAAASAQPQRHAQPHQQQPPRGGRPPYEGPSFLSSTSAPPSTTTPDASGDTGTSTRSGMQPLHQRREDQLRRALANAAPTPVEVSAVASAAYVQALMGLIDRHGESVLEMTAAIDALRERRERRYAEAEEVTRQHDAELHHLRGERADLSLQVQEERERSTRLLHENTVLHAQQAEQREQLGKLVELCRARGKRLRVLGSAASGTRVAAAAAAAPASAEENPDADPDVDLARLGLGQRGSNSGAAAEQSTSTAAAAAGPTTTSPPSSPSSPPASLSIHRAAGVAPPRAGLRTGPPPAAAAAAATPSSSAAWDGVADDAEVAALLNVPYKLHVPSSPSGAVGSSGSNAVTHTITANTATTAHLLALTAEVNMLRQQLDEQRITYEHERGLRSRETDEVHRQHLDQEAKYRATVEQLEMLHEESLRNLVQYRHTTEKQLRDVRGQVDWLRAALQEALDLAEKDRRRQHNELYATEQRISRQYYPKVQSLQAELEECRRSGLAQAHDHAKRLAEKDALVEELQQRLKAEASQRKRIEERYRLEMEGVHSELDLMRQSLRQMERRVYYRDARDQASEEAQLELERYYT